MGASIVVPDDFPSIFAGSPAHERAKEIGPVAVFREAGAHREDELIHRIGGAHTAINLRAHAKFTERVLSSCRSLKLISVWGTGVDNIDLAAAARLGITVCNTPGVNAPAVAEHALALMLAVARKLIILDREMRTGQWPRAVLTQLSGKTLGVFGLGAIGSRVSALGKGIGMEVMAWSAQGDSERACAAGATPVEKDDLLRSADVVSLHLRLTPETTGFLGRREFSLMKPAAILINTARGALVDREAMIEALSQGRILGAGLDVFHREPLAPDDPILSFQNVVLTPHNSGQTSEVIRDGLLRAVENIELFLRGAPRDVISAPAP
jgi:D-3-phosphoglycerate dehydrogenase